MLAYTGAWAIWPTRQWGALIGGATHLRRAATREGRDHVRREEQSPVAREPPPAVVLSVCYGE